MSQQLDLFTVQSHSIFQDIQPHVVAKFWRYHKENPHVFELFRHYSMAVKKAGRKTYGAGAIFERIRWHLSVETSGDDFKLNNNFRSCYARLLIMEDSSFDGFFLTRTSMEVA